MLNKGIDWNADDNIYWKLEVQRYEGCKIILHGNAEFEATNVVLQVCLYMNTISFAIDCRTNTFAHWSNWALTKT